MLPDDVLLEIFHFYVDEDMDDFESLGKQITEGWITLAHVCRRWRSVVFQSPLRLNLRLHCTPTTRARDTLDIWPPLPLIIRNDHNINSVAPTSVGNIVTALEHNNHVCQIELINLLELGYVTDSAAMQVPFLALTDLRLSIDEDDRPELILPDSFLGGTAPRLRSLHLDGISFPGLPKLLLNLSTSHLVKLRLGDIPCSGYIPPEAMATSLSALTSLKSLCLHFQYPRPRPALESRRPPPPPLTRSILPNLTEIEFRGVSEYLEVILARIDSPQLHKLDISFFNQIIFDTPQLSQFIGRRPTLRSPKKGHIIINTYAIIVRFPPQTSDLSELSVRIRCTTPEWQLSFLEQVCTSSLPSLSVMEDLYIVKNPYWRPHRQGNVENTQWLDLLRSFIAVKNLYLLEEFVPSITLALQELVRGRTTEVLPILENIFLEWLPPSGPLHDCIEKFVAARRLTSHPVKVSRWDGKMH